MLLDEANEAVRSDSLDRRKNSQPAHIQQISPVGLISLLYAFSLYIFYHQGFIGGNTFIGAAAAVLCLVMVFYGVFRFSLNTRFPESSLMLPQLLGALLIMLTVAYLEPVTQIALVPF